LLFRHPPFLGWTRRSAGTSPFTRGYDTRPTGVRAILAARSQHRVLESEPASIERRAERNQGGGARFCYLDGPREEPHRRRRHLEYLDVEEARSRSDLRLVLIAGVPGPWGEAAKGLCHEICGENGLGWSRRLMMLHEVLQVSALADSPAGETVRRLGARYGYSPGAAESAPLCPMPEFLRAQYDVKDAQVSKAVDPILLEHRDFIYRECLQVPLDF
jgi:hypothetical protein